MHVKHENLIVEVSRHLNWFAETTIQCSLKKKKKMHLATRKMILRVSRVHTEKWKSHC